MEERMSNEQAQQVIADLRDITMRQAVQTIEQANQIADLHRQLQERDATIARLQRRQAELEAALTWTLASGVEALTMADYVEGMKP
jgi:uncharacterized protein YhaN